MNQLCSVLKLARYATLLIIRVDYTLYAIDHVHVYNDSTLQRQEAAVSRRMPSVQPLTCARACKEYWLECILETQCAAANPLPD